MANNGTAAPLSVGEKLPEFTLQDALENWITLADTRGPNGTVVAFIHGSFCPSCMPQLQRLNAIAPELARHGVGLVCITHDAVPTIFGFQASTTPPLQYPLLADSDPTLAYEYGVKHDFYDSPFASIFLADADDRILFVDVSPDPVCNPDREAMLAIVRRMSQPQPVR